MICISIGEYSLYDCKKAVHFCERVSVMGEIRLDLCRLSKDEVSTLFSQAKVPLIATCRRKTTHLITPAIDAGAAYVDIELYSNPAFIKESIQYAKKKGCRVILSMHDYNGTPSLERLKNYYTMAVNYGADIVKISTTATSMEDAERVITLYQEVKKLPQEERVPLIVIAMGDFASYTRLEGIYYNSPILYCSLNEKRSTASGQIPYSTIKNFILRDTVEGEIQIPSSKSVAQRAILCASIAKGKSILENFSRCKDVDAAIGVAKQLGAKVFLDGNELTIIGAGYPNFLKKINKEKPVMSAIMLPDTLNLFVGESGLLSRLCVPIAAQLEEGVTITGEGSLLGREMYGCKEALENFGAKCLLTAEETLPAVVCGPLKGGNKKISGKQGSQLISGLLISLPMSKKATTLTVTNPTSVPYIKLTLDVLKKFGIEISFVEKGGDTIFSIEGKQKYEPAEITIEGDWSSAANYLVAGAIFGNLLLKGLNLKSHQADKAIRKILSDCNANIEVKKSGISVSRSHLLPFEYDGNNSPDLLPILAVLASFCEGTSTIYGVERLKNKECDRSEAISKEFVKMGMDIKLEGDKMTVNGLSLSRRFLENKMLKGGSFNSYNDHRIAMALKIASLGCNSKVIIDGIKCVEKSYPLFIETFDSVLKKNNR